MSASGAMRASRVWYVRPVARADDSGGDFASDVLAHADAMYGLACYLTGRGPLAEELVQETYARALAASTRFEPGTNLKAWLLRILRNVFLDDRRRAKNDPTLRGVSDELMESRPEPSEAPVRGDGELERMRGLVARDIEAAMAALTESSRTIVLLDLEGLSEIEIADVMDCAPGTVKSRLSRARAALRDHLSEYAR